MQNNKFIPCRKCSNKPGPKPGFIYSEKNGFNIIIECSCHVAWRQQQELELKLEAAQINPDFSFEDYRGSKSREEFKAFKTFASNYNKYNYKTMVYLWGKNGCQKTSMAQALGKILIEKGFSVQYTLMNNLINNLVKDFNDSLAIEKDAFIKRCLESDLLIVDEAFDSNKVTMYKSGYQIPFLDAFIRNRFEINKKSILFISNVAPQNIDRNVFGVSLQNLVDRNTKESCIEFKDVYLDEVSKPDVLGLFRR